MKPRAHQRRVAVWAVHPPVPEVGVGVRREERLHDLPSQLAGRFHSLREPDRTAGPPQTAMNARSRADLTQHIRQRKGVRGTSRRPSCVAAMRDVCPRLSWTFGAAPAARRACLSSDVYFCFALFCFLRLHELQVAGVHRVGRVHEGAHLRIPALHLSRRKTRSAQPFPGKAVMCRSRST